MQISTANLLLASQQPRQTGGAGTAETAFWGALAEAASRAGGPARPAQFSPPSFDDAAVKRAEVTPADPAPMPRISNGYTAFAALGSKLDIRV